MFVAAPAAVQGRAGGGIIRTGLTTEVTGDMSWSLSSGGMRGAGKCKEVRV
jgi:hypothetical protein